MQIYGIIYVALSYFIAESYPCHILIQNGMNLVSIFDLQLSQILWIFSEKQTSLLFIIRGNQVIQQSNMVSILILAQCIMVRISQHLGMLLYSYNKKWRHL